MLSSRMYRPLSKLANSPYCNAAVASAEKTALIFNRIDVDISVYHSIGMLIGTVLAVITAWWCE